jgi:hypothetical protein
MHALKIGSIVAGAVVLFAGIASAGYKTSNNNVVVTKNADGSGLASGALGAARASADLNQEIGCFNYSTPAGRCNAWDATNRTVSCYTTDPSMIAVIRTVGSDSFVSFVVDKNGFCTTVTTFNDSAYQPKSP